LSPVNLADQTADAAPIGRQHVPSREALADVKGALKNEHQPRPLLIYVHIPFCSSKCTFCVWVAGIDTPQLRSPDEVRARYVQALTAQIEYLAPHLADIGYVPRCVYWGGGTPSILTPVQIETIGDALQKNFDLSAVTEYSVESSPETLTAEKIRAFQAAGMNRLSIGVQSFDEAELRRAGRAHSPEDAQHAVRTARQQGCTNLNIDMITGFPKQTPEILASTLRTLLTLQPEHVTCYTYVAIDRTVMARQMRRGHLPASSAEQRAAAQDQAHRALAADGYDEYMSMYYSIRPERSFAGESYYFDWHGDFVGFGSGAHSILGHHLIGNKPGRLEEFISSPTVCDQHQKMGVGIALDASFKLLSLGRRLDFERFRAKFGFDVDAVLNHRHMRATRALLDRLERPLVVTSTEAYVSAPETGWHGGELIRLTDKAASLMPAAR
jgi:coproporphyrinogen III oxidase-like Fe-S oxidoreductase